MADGFFLEELKMTTKYKPYAEKLKDPRWQKKRLEVMQRAGFKCESCNCENETLHIHHLIYSRTGNPWAVENRWLECLCSTCHAARTEANEINRAVFEMNPTRDVIGINGKREYLEIIGEESP
jgi:5-methylcytosine-specific restriction endonuclease McrA